MRISCNICKRTVRRPNNHLECVLCKAVSHNSCANACAPPYFCNMCFEKLMPFQGIENDELENLYDIDIHDIVNLLNDVDWDERLPETREKAEICEYYNMKLNITFGCIYASIYTSEHAGYDTCSMGNRNTKRQVLLYV